MPCTVDPIPPKRDKQEIDLIVEVVNGKISVRNVGSDYSGKYPTVKKIVGKARKKYKTSHYRVHGAMIVLVSPCPKGC